MSTSPSKLIAYFAPKSADTANFNLQRDKILRYVDASKCELVGEFTEIFTDDARDLRELKKAIEACKTHGAKLAIGSFDDVPRKFQFLLKVMLGGVDCVVVRGEEDSYRTRLSEVIGEYWR
jgi:hypothetical protein